MQEVFGKIKNRITGYLKKQVCVKSGWDIVAINAEVHQIIKEVEKEYSDGWIPCSERLPENDKYILLSFENFPHPEIGRYKGDEDGGAFYIGDDTETCISQDLIVNAWQPLPEPYKQKWM